jgi:hypothetical protein
VTRILDFVVGMVFEYALNVFKDFVLLELTTVVKSFFKDILAKVRMQKICVRVFIVKERGRSFTFRALKLEDHLIPKASALSVPTLVDTIYSNTKVMSQLRRRVGSGATLTTSAVF